MDEENDRSITSKEVQNSLSKIKFYKAPGLDGCHME